MSQNKANYDVEFMQILRNTTFMRNVYLLYKKHHPYNPQSNDYNVALLQLIKEQFAGEKLVSQLNLRSKLTHVFQEKNDDKLTKIFHYSAGPEAVFKRKLAKLSHLLPQIQTPADKSKITNSTATLKAVFKKFEQRLLSRPNYQPAIREALKYESPRAMIDAFLNKYIEITDAYKSTPSYDSPINKQILEHLIENHSQDFQDAIRTLSTQPKHFNSIANCFSGRTKQAVEIILQQLAPENDTSLALKPRGTNTNN